jgi:hypothetical protein
MRFTFALLLLLVAVSAGEGPEISYLNQQVIRYMPVGSAQIKDLELAIDGLGLDVWHRDPDGIVVRTTKDIRGLLDLTHAGSEVVIYDVQNWLDSSRYSRASGTGWFDSFHSYDEIQAYMIKLAGSP